MIYEDVMGELHTTRERADNDDIHFLFFSLIEEYNDINECHKQKRVRH